MLKIHDATLRYAKQLVFEHLSFSLAQGEWLAIMGASGVGKTTLLRLIAGLQHFRTEKLTEISGQVTWKEEANFEVSYMAQQDGLFPWLSVWDNILLSFHLNGHTPDINAAQQLLAAVGLENYRDTKPKALSGGMRQRVALARTLIQKRELVLMDEPFSALDAMTRMEMQTLSARLMRQAQKTMVMVTHDPWEALRLASSVLILGGQPATVLARVELPPSTEPRDLTDPLVIQQYQTLMRFFH